MERITEAERATFQEDLATGYSEEDWPVALAANYAAARLVWADLHGRLAAEPELGVADAEWEATLTEYLSADNDLETRLRFLIDALADFAAHSTLQATGRDLGRALAYASLNIEAMTPQSS
jgi:hypothetical protein